jgi:hypothetical protein
MSITRLTGGLTPGDGADPRTFPAIWNATADVLDDAILPSGGSAGQVLVKDSGTDYDAVWAVRQYNFLTEPVANLYFAQISTGIRDDTTQARNLNDMVFAPTIVSRTITVDRIAINVSVAEAGATPRLGIYSATSANRPGDLILDCGTVDASTIGNKQITISATIPAGLFFLAVAHQGASSTLRLTNCTIDTGIIKGHTNLNAALLTAPNSYLQTGVSGALPASYSGGDTATERRHPMIAVRTATVI